MAKTEVGQWKSTPVATGDIEKDIDTPRILRTDGGRTRWRLYGRWAGIVLWGEELRRLRYQGHRSDTRENGHSKGGMGRGEYTEKETQVFVDAASVILLTHWESLWPQRREIR